MTTENSTSSIAQPAFTDKKAHGKFNGERHASFDKRDGKSGGYQGSGKKSNDIVFETKRDEYSKKQTSINAEIGKLKNRLSAVSANIRAATSQDTNRDIKDELKGKINALKAKRDELYELKEPVQRKLSECFDNLKRKTDDIDSAKEKLQYKKIEEIDRKISEMEKQVENGSLKLIDEKRIVAEISKIRKNRKALEALSAQQSSIDDIMKHIELYKVTLKEKDNEIHAYSSQIKLLASELSSIGANRGSHQARLQTLFDESDALKKQLDAQYKTKNEAYAGFQKAQEDHRVWIEQENIKREEQYKRREIEYSIRQLEKELRALDLPPGANEIEQCINLQNYIKVYVLKEIVSLNPSVVSTPEGSAALAPLELRQVEKVDSEFILKNKFQREEEFYFAPKKTGKSGRKGHIANGVSNNATDTENTPTTPVKLPLWVVTGLEELGVGMVTVVGDAVDVIKKLEEIKVKYETDQNEKLKTVDSQHSAIKTKLDAENFKLKNIASLVAESRKNGEKKPSPKNKETQEVNV